LRSEFDSRLRESHGLAKLRAEDLFFHHVHHDENLPAAGFAILDDEAFPSESAASFEPWPDGDSPTTAHTSAGASPGQNGSPVTIGRPRSTSG
jgi:hypothetical protein